MERYLILRISFEQFFLEFNNALNSASILQCNQKKTVHYKKSIIAPKEKKNIL